MKKKETNAKSTESTMKVRTVAIVSFKLDGTGNAWVEREEHSVGS